MEPLTFTPSYRAQLIRKFGSRIPTTGEGLLVGYYRPDLLPSSPSKLILPQSPFKVLDSNIAKANKAEGDTSYIAIQPRAVTEDRSEDLAVFLENKKNEDELAAMGASPDLSNDTVGADDIAQHLRASYVELVFDHGYPAMPNGMPFWHKMEFETGFAFAAFQMFLEIGDDGPRQLFELANNRELLQVAKSQAQRDLTTTELGFQLQEYFIVHYWHSRAKAYDLYKEAALRHQRLRKADKMEEKHFKIAGIILEKLEAYFGTEEFMNEMTPKTAMDALAKLVAIQRVSVGLPASGPLSVQQQPQETSFEMIMRSIAQKQGAASEGIGAGFGAGTSHTKQMIDQILTDPDSAKSIQEVIIKISTAHAGVEATPEKRFPGKIRPAEVIDDATVIDNELRGIGAVTDKS